MCLQPSTGRQPSSYAWPFSPLSLSLYLSISLSLSLSKCISCITVHVLIRCCQTGKSMTRLALRHKTPRTCPKNTLNGTSQFCAFHSPERLFFDRSDGLPPMCPLCLSSFGQKSSLSRDIHTHAHTEASSTKFADTARTHRTRLL